MKDFKVACFDMDGTLITNTDSVEYLCSLNGKKQDAKEIDIREKNDEITWIEADYLKAKLFSGVDASRAQEEFEDHIKLINNIEKVLSKLKENNIKSILVTAGPIQVAEALGKKFEFDRVYGSLYEVENGCFTGNVKKHLGDSGKVESLLSYCEEINETLDNVVAIGDSASDIKVFEKSAKSIAINYSYKLEGKADVYIMTEDLYDILEHII